MAGQTTLLTISSADLAERQKKFEKLSAGEAAKIVTDELTKYGEAFTEALAETVPVREGILKESISFKIVGANTSEAELRVQIGNNKRPEVVVRSLLFGSVPHEIKPKRPGGVLKFVVDGETVFAKRVNHPGAPRDPFFNIAKQRTESDLRRLRARIGSLIIEQIEE